MTRWATQWRQKNFISRLIAANVTARAPHLTPVLVFVLFLSCALSNLISKISNQWTDFESRRLIDSNVLLLEYCVCIEDM